MELVDVKALQDLKYDGKLIKSGKTFKMEKERAEKNPTLLEVIEKKPKETKKSKTTKKPKEDKVEL